VTLRVAAFQYDIAWENREDNWATVRAGVAGAVAQGARVVVLPEMYATGFSMNTAVIGEPVDGPSSQFLVDIARQHDIWIGGSVAERDPGQARPHNRFVLAAPDGTTHRYSKRHLFSFGGEDRHYEPGSQPVVVDVDGVRCSLHVCYDLRFGEDFWPLAPSIDCHLVIANWPRPREPHWSALLVARAIENQAWVVGVNRIGVGGRLEYAGGSAIVDPVGGVVAAARESAALLLADIDAERVRQVRDRWPFVADRST
jgi:predicted amidohydrolase